MVAPKSTDEPVAIEGLDARRRRLRFRAWHRGTREMDLVLGPFADARAEFLDTAALGRFELFLEEADPDLLKWLTGQETPPAGADVELLRQVLAFRLDTAARK
jgi:antitoxin CptB